uniref:Uncharacterized protein n=1 Tax=Globodera rostochiensis TaxID=31243 RepID=A0A914IBI6_GLORO
MNQMTHSGFSLQPQGPAFPPMPGGMPPPQQHQQQPPAFPSMPGGFPPQQQQPPSIPNGMPPPQQHQQQPPAFPSMPGGFPPQQQQPPSIPNGMPPPQQQQQPPAFPSMPGGFPPQQHQQQPPAFSSMPGGFPPQQQQLPAFPSMPGGMPPPQQQQPPAFPSMPGGMPPPQQQQPPAFPGGMPPPQQQQPPAFPGGMPPPQQQQPPAFPSMPGGMPPPQQQQPPAFPGGMPPPQQQQPPAFPSMPGGMPPSQQQQPPAFPGGFPQQQPGAFSSMPGGFPTGPPQPQRQRLDPDMMPSLVQVADDDQNTRSGLFPTGFPHAESPPLVSTEIIAQDQGNANPKFMRSTLYAVPQTNDMTKATQLPLSLAICPFAKLHQSEYPPPVIDLGDIGPVRCQRCKAYMCPFMEFVDGGRKFRCPFCHANTPVEDGYFAHLDHTGRRTDIQHRPELFLGSYEFVATKQYCKNGISPKQPAFIFMLDVSYNAVRSGMVELFCRNIMDMLRELPRENFREGPSSMRIGLATYDQTVHFYNLSQPNRAEMLVVSDIADVFVPFVDGFLVEFEQAESALSVCLREIVNNFAQTRITETALGPTIQAGLDALRSADRAGKLFIFHTSLPVLEGAPGQLKSREDRKLLGTDKEKTILSPATDFYAKLGEECVKWGCAVDLFLFPNAFVDVASIAPAVSTTGGIVYKYQYFDAERDGERFLADLRHDITREVAFDVMMRLRTSTGIRPTGFHGAFFMQNTTDIEVAALDADKAVQIEIKYDDKLDERESAYFQMAVLFTSCGGQRRLRVHNLSLPISTDYAQLYRLIDEDCLATHLFKQAEQTLREKTPKEMRDELTVRCAQMLAAYREKCSESAPLGQLILPECAKLLPLHVNCIERHDALNGGAEITVDDRAWMMSLVPSLSVLATAHLLYPRIYPLTALGSPQQQQPTDEAPTNGGGGSTGVPSGNGTTFHSLGSSSWEEEDALVSDTTIDGEQQQRVVEVPAQVRASFDYFQPQEAYLIENGLVAFVYVGREVPQEWLHNVFGISSVTHLDTEKHELPKRPNAHSTALRKLWLWANMGRERRLKLFIVKDGDALEAWMKKFLVEDRYAQTANSYVDFLCAVHREIRSILS